MDPTHEQTMALVQAAKKLAEYDGDNSAIYRMLVTELEGTALRFALAYFAVMADVQRPQR